MVVVQVLLAALAPVMAKHKYFSKVRLAERVGNMIYEKDRAAWLATNSLFAEATKEGVIGWITVEHGTDWLVRFLGGTSSAPCVLYEVPISESAGSLKKKETCEPLDDTSAAMFHARQTAISTMTKRCSETYNTVVLPGEVIGKNGWLVYLLAATTEPDALVIGGHYRVRVSSDGKTAKKSEPLFNSCLTLPPEDGQKSEFAFATHVISDAPIETHVFVSLSTATPLYVGTDYAMWAVEEGKIRLVMSGKAWEDYRTRAVEEANRNGSSSSD